MAKLFKAPAASGGLPRVVQGEALPTDHSRVPRPVSASSVSADGRTLFARDFGVVRPGQTLRVPLTSRDAVLFIVVRAGALRTMFKALVR